MCYGFLVFWGIRFSGFDTTKAFIFERNQYAFVMQRHVNCESK